ncbi:max dimerization protein 3 isoform X1 [Xenopus laevis]|uniref:Max dimerization protein 3 n=3 Tax=Xenopus laevis TaxID=8355 RepID=MAD3_XENLA|nr:max dimerization protein 3 [Xenopus laevis]XP_041441216.1 max dimerization protein 3 isoform X1 [Xenopus laevis]XP_041441217.1 max dimerization protein 3 isoform X1 [Xenopus laevis]XP_041441218.1 max dimerization protein 3 isoform X1 [Xenopus laevis]Q0VH33.1 RecName: Full=Max dimerization protein 3; Short=Max dimerizer 3; AltName: Full=Max-associated protein 3; AltName: Full=Max-interacting transcriptional repressor MAD3 [Xenopus laevis]AAI27417.1 LOC779069 protein [Xenopus laevis]AAY32592
MEQLPSNLQVLLQAAEYVERREREAEHGYASILPCDPATPGRRKRQRTNSNPDNVRSVHNELEKHRRAQLRRCLEQLKQQVPLSMENSRHTTLSLLHRAKQHIKKLEDQELRAKSLKEKLRADQQKLRQRLKRLLPPNTERIRTDSLDSSNLSSERSDSDQEDLEVDVEGIILSGNEGELFVSFSAGLEHSYSTPAHAWL